jgi:hypothetical protein
VSTFTDADSFRVDALTAGCQFIYGGEMHTVQRVQVGPRNTYLVTDEPEEPYLLGDGRTHQPYRTFVFATGTWIKGYA